MSGTVEFVEYQGSVCEKIAEFLRSQNFGPASSYGAPNCYDCRFCGGDDSVGIVTGWWLLKTFIGKVCYGSSGHPEVSERRWILEVYGREHVELLKELADKLALRFGVDISLRLVSGTSEPTAECTYHYF